jgi:hypothetical protein
MRTPRAARFGARAKRFVNNALDGTCASPAFGAATEAAVKLLGISRQVRSRAHGIADVVIAKDVAGTDNHTKTESPIGDARNDLFKAVTGCKRKNRLFKQFQTDA